MRLVAILAGLSLGGCSSDGHDARLLADPRVVLHEQVETDIPVAVDPPEHDLSAAALQVAFDSPDAAEELDWRLVDDGGLVALRVTPGCNLAHTIDGKLHRAEVEVTLSGDRLAPATVVLDIDDDTGPGCVAEDRMWLTDDAGCEDWPAEQPVLKIDRMNADQPPPLLCLGFGGRDDQQIARLTALESTAPDTLLKLPAPDTLPASIGGQLATIAVPVRHNPDIVGSFNVSYTLAGNSVNTSARTVTHTLQVGNPGDAAIELLAVPEQPVDEFSLVILPFRLHSGTALDASCRVRVVKTTPACTQMAMAAPPTGELIRLVDALGRSLAEREWSERIECNGPGAVFSVRYTPTANSCPIERLTLELEHGSPSITEKQVVDLGVRSIAESLPCAGPGWGDLVACAELDGDDTQPEVLAVGGGAACLFSGTDGRGAIRTPPAEVPFALQSLLIDDGGDGRPIILGELDGGRIRRLELAVDDDGAATWAPVTGLDVGIPLARAAGLGPERGGKVTHLVYPSFDGTSWQLLAAPLAGPAIAGRIVLAPSSPQFTVDQIVAVAPADLDGDGANELVVAWSCLPGISPPAQICYQAVRLTWSGGQPALDEQGPLYGFGMPALSTVSMAARTQPGGVQEILITTSDGEWSAGVEHVIATGSELIQVSTLVAPGAPRAAVAIGDRALVALSSGLFEHDHDPVDGVPMWLPQDPVLQTGLVPAAGYGGRLAACAVPDRVVPIPPRFVVQTADGPGASFLVSRLGAAVELP